MYNEKFNERFVRQHAPGDVVFREGDRGHAMYVVLAGSIDIVKRNDAEDLCIANLGTGEMFGEMALIDSGTRMATAKAGADGAKLMSIDQARFVYMVGQQPAFALAVMQTMAKRLAKPAPTPAQTPN
ncbi:MAG TPA: cyclic nucleotide-binding domain-containing protein [Burkholderiaceae bacterium]|nr:cyclic nucleotide-binding domain-containing protein [Burkholderiaceae bacterium]